MLFSFSRGHHAAGLQAADALARVFDNGKTFDFFCGKQLGLPLKSGADPGGGGS